MVVSDTASIGYLGRKSRKSSPVVPLNTNFNFPSPAGFPGGAVATPDGGAFMTPDYMNPTMAPTFMDSNMPWIIGGGILLVGGVALAILYKMGKI